MKRSISRKETFEDKFVRKYYTKDSAHRYIKWKKKENNRKFRREGKNLDEPE